MRDDGVRRQGQDLEARAVEGDEVLFDESIAQLEEVVERQLEGGCDAVLAVVADAVAVGGEDDEEVERALRVGERREEAVVEKAVGQVGKTASGGADAVRARGRAEGGRERS